VEFPNVLHNGLSSQESAHLEFDDFDSLISRMERIARDRPESYGRRVFWLAGLGYAYLALLIVVLSALTVAAGFSAYRIGFAGVKLTVIVGVLWLTVVRSLWVRSEPPRGVSVARQDAPQLFRLLDALRARLKSAPIHEVLITPAFNAGIAQLPRLGIFGWHRNYLALGLPLMKALTVEQFKSVLAHEAGHLAGGHARASNWIYRLRVVWAQLESNFEQHPRFGSGVIRAFFRWYIPYFNAVSFPFARANEYQADADAVLVTSKQRTAQALTGVHLISHYLQQRYWPTAIAAAQNAPQAVTPFRGFIAQAVRETPELKAWLESALTQPTSHQDTHPSLSERLKAIGAAAEFSPPGPSESADKLLGKALSHIEAMFDDAWTKAALARNPQPHFPAAPPR
jgi:Zn-dependent protease with chaperone function